LALAAMAVLAVPSTGCQTNSDAPTAVTADPWLKEATRELGLDFVRAAEPTGSYFMPEIMGSGAAFLDFDGDDLLDLFVVDGRWQGAAANARMRNRLFRQHPNGSFTDVTEPAGFLEQPGYGVGVAAADVDNDGDTDLYVSGFGGDALWLNNGDGTFSPANDRLAEGNVRWGTAAAFFDADADGFLDLFVVNYLDYYPATTCEDVAGRADYCGPQAFEGTASRLYHNLAGLNERGAQFEDVTAAAGLAAAAGPGLGLICRDFNGDRLPDLYVANDQAPNRLWMARPNLTFVDEAVTLGVATNGLGQFEASMGVAWGDFNADDACDLFLTNLRSETNTLYLGHSSGLFVDGTASSGLGPPSVPWTGFGTVACDLDLDGDLDLLAVNGAVKRRPLSPGSSLGPYWNDYAEPCQIYLNDGRGRFHEAAALSGLFGARCEVARALVAGDVDNDGDLDFLVTHVAGPTRLWKNETPRRGHWLRVRLQAAVGNRDCLLARVTVHTAGGKFTREAQPSSGYLASHDPRLHFGLGEAAAYRQITVEWPDGQMELFEGGAADRQVVLTRGAGLAQEFP
jgi:hypothetical protein